MPKCIQCKFTKGEEDFRANSKKCRQCHGENRSDDQRLMREAVMRTLGSSCACCGETEQVFLDIDHINNDGWKDRKETNYSTWRLAFKEPERFQILCRNCNWAKYRGGCPHTQMIRK